MSNPSWLNPCNQVTIIQGGQDVTVPADEQQLPAGTIQVTPNSEIPGFLQATPPAGVSVQVQCAIPNTTPGAQ